MAAVEPCVALKKARCLTCTGRRSGSKRFSPFYPKNDEYWRFMGQGDGYSRACGRTKSSEDVTQTPIAVAGELSG
jgi:hypothetical protein